MPLCFTLVRPQLAQWIQLWSPQNRKNMQAEAGLEEGHKNDQRSGALHCEDRLRELRFFDLEKSRLREDFIVTFQ